MRAIEDKALLTLIIAVSLAFAWIIWPFYGAVLWGTVTALLFAPLYRWITKAMGQRRNLAALSVVIIVVAIVILPAALIGASLIREASGLYARMQSGELDFAVSVQQAVDTLPPWAKEWLDRLGLASLAAMQEKAFASLTKGSRFVAEQAFSVGMSTFDFFLNLLVMLYLLFFLLRDGPALFARVKRAIPLAAEQKQALLLKFAVVIRATVKGDLLVSLLQGALGGLIFWLLGIGAPLLWGVVMAVLALLPMVGAGLVWGPVAVYFLATGAVWQGLGLIAYGLLVMGLVDYLLRPILVGKDAKMPNYMVLISTIGGMAAFGLNGFIIGPLIAAMFIAAWDIFSAERQ